MKSSFIKIFTCMFVLFICFDLFAQYGAPTVEELAAAHKFNRSIHIMAMLLVGFGFLMAFVKKYGRSSLTASFLLVSLAIPVYMFINRLGIFEEPSRIAVDNLIFAEFAAASLLIAAGALLGRLTLSQYLILGLIFIPAYMFNEWIVLRGGFNLVPFSLYVDTGRSIMIHAFGAIFGTIAMLSMPKREEFDKPVEHSPISDQFALLGSMMLWVFWPSFSAAMVHPEKISHAIVAVVLSLCGATLATYVTSIVIRKKVSVMDIANASLAGGVVIGSSCDTSSFRAAFFLGILAGILATFGFAYLKPKVQAKFKKVDTCGVLYLHGLPGLLGGFAAIYVVPDITKGIQAMGTIITIILAVSMGFLAGKVLSLFGKGHVPYEDKEDFIEDQKLA